MLVVGDGIRERFIKLKVKVEERELEKDEEYIFNWGGSVGRVFGNRVGEFDEFMCYDLFVVWYVVDVI